MTIKFCQLGAEMRRKPLSRCFWLFSPRQLARSWRYRIQSIYIYMFWEKQRKHCAVEHSLPVSNHQLLGCLGAILVTMTASWSAFLIPGFLLRWFLISSPTPDLLPSPPPWLACHLCSVLGVFYGGSAKSLPLQPFQWFWSNYFMVLNAIPFRIQSGFFFPALHAI